MLKTQNSEKLFRRARELLVGGVNSPVRAFKSVGGTPRFAARAKGPYLWDADGNRYLDFVGSWGPMILGQAHPSILSAVKKTLAKGFSFGASSELEIQLAERVIAAFPSIEKVRFVSSGTEAVMGAIRLARGYTGRTKIVKFSGCYHGHSDGLLVKAGSGAATLGIPDSAGVPACYTQETIVLDFNDFNGLAACFEKYGAEIAALIVEPVVGNMGVVLPKPGFLETLRELTKQSGAVLIFDEVMTGFRLAFGGAQEIYKIRPDLTCLGKIIGGGFPVGAYGGSRGIMDCLSPLGPVYQAGTLSGNPVAMAAGISQLDLLKKRPPYAALEKNTKRFAEGLLAEGRRRGIPLQLNRAGSMFTIFFTESPVTDFASACKSDTQAFGRFFHALLDQKIYFPPSQFEAAFTGAAHSPALLDRALRSAARAFDGMASR